MLQSAERAGFSNCRKKENRERTSFHVVGRDIFMYIKKKGFLRETIIN